MSLESQKDTDSKAKKTFYITTSIPYATSEPHIGNAMDWLYADALARYHKIWVREVIYSGGSDEHGSKIAEKAEAAGQNPAEFVAQLSPKIQAMHAQIDSHPTHFQRTDSQQHRQIVAQLWGKMFEKGDIYKGTYSGLYCVGCETFYTPTEVKDNGGICPLHNKAYVQIEEENYFFRLSKYGPALQEAYAKGQTKVIPDSRQNEILSLIKSGLTDISISRPIESVSWGIPVPGDEGHVIYVWFEALMNYITLLNYPDGEDFKKAWPTDIQVVGKDNLRFHAAIYPAMLLSLDLDLVQKLFVHGFLTVEGKKMSKTIGNVVQPIDIINEYGIDAYRYYFLRHVSAFEDGDFSWARFENVYNAELGNALGNLISRVAKMVQQYQDGITGYSDASHDLSAYHRAFESLEINKAAQLAWERVQGLNQYIEEQKPWQIAKKGDPKHLAQVLSYLVSSLLELSDVIEPFTPGAGAAIRDIFGGGAVKDFTGVLYPRKSLQDKVAKTQ